MEAKSIKKAEGSWRRIRDYNFFSVEDLPDYQPITITIAKIDEAENLKAAGKVIDRAFLMYAVEPIMDKPMILKGTENMKRLSRIIGTPDVSKWVGHRIVIQQESWKAFGREDVGLRVKEIYSVPEGETGKVVLSIASPNFQTIKSWLKEGKGTLESVTKKYHVLTSALNELKRIVPNG